MNVYMVYTKCIYIYIYMHVVYNLWIHISVFDLPYLNRKYLESHAAAMPSMLC